MKTDEVKAIHEACSDYKNFIKSGLPGFLSDAELRAAYCFYSGGEEVQEAIKHIRTCARYVMDLEKLSKNKNGNHFRVIARPIIDGLVKGAIAYKDPIIMKEVVSLIESSKPCLDVLSDVYTEIFTSHFLSGHFNKPLDQILIDFFSDMIFVRFPSGDFVDKSLMQLLMDGDVALNELLAFSQIINCRNKSLVQESLLESRVGSDRKAFQENNTAHQQSVFFDKNEEILKIRDGFGKLEPMSCFEILFKSNQRESAKLFFHQNPSHVLSSVGYQGPLELLCNYASLSLIGEFINPKPVQCALKSYFNNVKHNPLSRLARSSRVFRYESYEKMKHILTEVLGREGARVCLAKPDESEIPIVDLIVQSFCNYPQKLFGYDRVLNDLVVNLEILKLGNKKDSFANGYLRAIGAGHRFTTLYLVSLGVEWNSSLVVRESQAKRFKVKIDHNLPVNADMVIGHYLNKTEKEFPLLSCISHNYGVISRNTRSTTVSKFLIWHLTPLLYKKNAGLTEALFASSVSVLDTLIPNALDYVAIKFMHNMFMDGVSSDENKIDGIVGAAINLISNPEIKSLSGALWIFLKNLPREELVHFLKSEINSFSSEKQLYINNYFMSLANQQENLECFNYLDDESERLVFFDQSISYGQDLYSHQIRVRTNLADLSVCTSSSHNIIEEFDSALKKIESRKIPSVLVPELLLQIAKLPSSDQHSIAHHVELKLEEMANKNPIFRFQDFEI